MCTESDCYDCQRENEKRVPTHTHPPVKWDAARWMEWVENRTIGDVMRKMRIYSNFHLKVLLVCLCLPWTRAILYPIYVGSIYWWWLTELTHTITAAKLYIHS